MVLRTLHILSVCRGYLAKKKYKEMVEEKNKAATKIQARYRGHKQRKSFKRKRLDFITGQAQILETEGLQSFLFFCL